jgi:hypothetical protein
MIYKLMPIKNRDGFFVAVDPLVASKLSAMYLWCDELGDIIIKNVKHRRYDRLLNVDRGARMVAFGITEDGRLLTFDSSS